MLISAPDLRNKTAAATLVIYDDAGQKTCLNSILFDNNHHYRFLIGPLKNLIGSGTNLNVDSDSCCSLNPNSNSVIISGLHSCDLLPCWLPSKVAGVAY